MLRGDLQPLLRDKDTSTQQHAEFEKTVETEDTERSWELRKFKQEFHELQTVSCQILAQVINVYCGLHALSMAAPISVWFIDIITAFVGSLAPWKFMKFCLCTTFEGFPVGGIRSVYVANMDLLCNISFVASEKEAKVKDTNDRLSASKAQQEAEERKMEGISEELKQRKELKITQGAVFRNIEENVQYRKTTKEIQKLDQEILDLEKQMLVFGEKERLEAEMQRHVKYIQDLSSETAEMANKNLDKYYNAFDKDGFLT